MLKKLHYKFLDDFTYLSVGLILIILNVLAVSLVDVIKPLANIHAEWLAYIGFGLVFISFLMYVLKTNGFEKGKEKWNTYIRIGAVATTIAAIFGAFFPGLSILEGTNMQLVVPAINGASLLTIEGLAMLGRGLLKGGL